MRECDQTQTNCSILIPAPCDVHLLTKASHNILTGWGQYIQISLLGTLWIQVFNRNLGYTEWSLTWSDVYRMEASLLFLDELAIEGRWCGSSTSFLPSAQIKWNTVCLEWAFLGGCSPGPHVYWLKLLPGEMDVVMASQAKATLKMFSHLCPEILFFDCF